MCVRERERDRERERYGTWVDMGGIWDKKREGLVRERERETLPFSTLLRAPE